MNLFGTVTSDRRKLRRAADQARKRNDHLAAAHLYADFLQNEPDDGAIHVQAGHMFKEARQFDKAEYHYAAALKLKPDDADLALQLGHFYKLAGQLERSEAEYRRALDLRAGWDEAESELANLLNWGWRGRYGEHSPARLIAVDGDRPSAGDEAVLSAFAVGAVLAPELVPTPLAELTHSHTETFNIRRLGRHERSHWGMVRTVRGIEAVRGFWTASSAISEVVISLNGHRVCRAEVRGPYILKFEIEKHRIKKYVFNAWINFNEFERGRYLLSIEGVEAGGRVRKHEEHVVVGDPFDPADYPSTDGIVDVTVAEGGQLEDQINAEASMVRSARRSFLQKPPETILVLRTDQLGDMVASVFAVQRLRALFPDAKIIGLLTTGNAEFAATLGAFDEILLINFPDDPLQRRRVMSLDEQAKLQKRLEPYRFDLAIDLADAGVSRPLLLLSGAPVLFGFRDREFDYLTAGYEGNSHDLWNRMECVGHASQAVSLIARLEALVQPYVKPIRRPELLRERLERFGLAAGQGYALLHAGARIEFSRWPHYHELADMILSRTNMNVVVMGLEGEARALLPAELQSNDRFKLIEGLLPFDDFDALISFCDLFVGNDSGPKHLASLRGVNVVGLHLARNNWTEWGQEHSGVVMSRRLPCAGCNIFYDAEECGKDFVCLRNIKADEVFNAGMSLITSHAVPK